MKKVAALILSLVLIFAIYYDLTVGTLPISTAQSTVIEIDQPSLIDPFTLIEIKPGDTVISILEEKQQGPLPVQINQLVSDFVDLNNGTKPEEIQIGESYKFPIYNNLNQ